MALRVARGYPTKKINHPGDFGLLPLKLWGQIPEKISVKKYSIVSIFLLLLCAISVGGVTSPDQFELWFEQDFFSHQLTPKLSIPLEGWVYSSARVTPVDDIMVTTTSGYFYLFDSKGKQKFKIDVGELFETTQIRIFRPYIVSTPTIAGNGTIIFGDNNGHVYFLGLDGSRKGLFKARDQVRSSPTVAKGGAVIVGSDDGHIYFLGLDGTLRAKFKTRGDVRSSATVGRDGTVVIGSDDGHVYFLGLDGTFKAKFPARGSIGAVRSSASIAPGGTVVIGSDDGHLYFLGLDGKEKIKPVYLGSAVRSSPAIAHDGTIVVGCDDGSVYFLDSDGSIKAKSDQIAERIRTSPIITSDQIAVVAAGRGNVHLFNLDGTPAGGFKSGEPRPFGGEDSFGNKGLGPSPDLTSDGTLVVASEGGKGKGMRITGGTLYLFDISVIATTEDPKQKQKKRNKPKGIFERFLNIRSKRNRLMQ